MKKSAINISKIIIATVITIAFTACPRNEPEPQKPIILVGQFTWSEWKQKAGWSDYSASDYTPNAEVLEELKQIIDLDSIAFIVFSSSWCIPDCAPQMPRIMKLLQAIGYEQDSVLIYGLSRDKLQPAVPILQYDIKFVPTLVIVNSDGMMGKIVEKPNESWEKHILTILQQ